MLLYWDISISPRPGVISWKNSFISKIYSICLFETIKTFLKIWPNYFRGLGLEEIFLNLINTHNDAGNLVLVIGTNAKEEEYFISQFAEKNDCPVPKSLTADISVSER